MLWTMGRSYLALDLRISWNKFNFFFNRDDDQQILDIVQAVIRQFQDSLGPGSYMILDESMIK